MALKADAKISKLILALALIFFLILPAKAQRSPSLEMKDGKVWVKNLDKEVLYTFVRYHHSQKDWQDVFPVQLKDAEGGISISGTYDVFETAVSFTPRFPFASGVLYKTTFFTEQLSNNYNEVYLPKMTSETLTLEFSDRKVDNSPSKVTAVFPSANVLPENLLKFHIRFSNAMTVGEIYKRVKILDHANQEVEKVFLIIDQEFWDEEMKVATLLLDPGRIKRGLKANLEMNAPLKQGETYTLVIDKNWKDINGKYLETDFQKTFRCTDADRISPSVDKWKVIAPKTTSDHLVVQTMEPINLISLSNGFMIKDSRDQRVEGEVDFLKGETGFSFAPKNGWNNGHYFLHINPLIEDLAGNNLNRVFDKDLNETSEQTQIHSQHIIPFNVKSVRK
jgi:hypothetical protein